MLIPGLWCVLRHFCVRVVTLVGVRGGGVGDGVGGVDGGGTDDCDADWDLYRRTASRMSLSSQIHAQPP